MNGLTLAAKGSADDIDFDAELKSLDHAKATVPAVAEYGMKLVEDGENDPTKQFDRIQLVSMGSGDGVFEKTAYEAYYNRSPVPVEAFGSTHYVLKPPPTLTPKTLVILISKSGTTSETLHAIQKVKGKCHSMIAFTKQGPSSDEKKPSLADIADKYFLLGNTEQTFLAIGMYAVALTEAIYAAIEKRDMSACLSSLDKLPELAVAAWRSNQDDAMKYGKMYNDKKVMHLIYTAADQMVATVFGKCVLREANRISALLETAENVPHHTCELADENNLFIVIMGGDKDLRPVIEKAKEFYEQHTNQLIVYDLDKFVTDGISDQYRAQIGAFVLYLATKGFGRAIAAARGEDFTKRKFIRTGIFDMTNYHGSK